MIGDTVVNSLAKCDIIVGLDHTSTHHLISSFFIWFCTNPFSCGTSMLAISLILKLNLRLGKIREVLLLVRT